MNIKINESVTITSGRVHEVWKRANMVLARNQGTWGSYYGTAAYKRQIEHFEKLSKHGHWLIMRLLKENGLNWKAWIVDRRGSDRLHDVKRGKKQYYEITRLE